MSEGAWSNQVRSRVIIAGPPPASGLYVYSPSIGKNNLVETVGITTGGKDPSGNVVLAGNTQYMNQAGTYYALQEAGGAGSVPLVRWLVSSGDQTGTYSTLFIVGLVTSAGLNGIDLGSAALFANPPQCFSAPLFARNPVTPASGAETWHAATPAGSWANITGAALEYRLMPDNTVEVHGQLTIPAGVTGPSNTITTLPAAYRPPNRNEPVYLVENLAASPFTGTIHHGLVRTATGNLDIFGAATAGNTLNVQIRYPLDGT